MSSFISLIGAQTTLQIGSCGGSSSLKMVFEEDEFMPQIRSSKETFCFSTPPTSSSKKCKTEWKENPDFPLLHLSNPDSSEDSSSPSSSPTLGVSSTENSSVYSDNSDDAISPKPSPSVFKKRGRPPTPLSPSIDPTLTSPERRKARRKLVNSKSAATYRKNQIKKMEYFQTMAHQLLEEKKKYLETFEPLKRELAVSKNEVNHVRKEYAKLVERRSTDKVSSSTELQSLLDNLQSTKNLLECTKKELELAKKENLETKQKLTQTIQNHQNEFNQLQNLYFYQKPTCFPDE